MKKTITNFQIISYSLLSFGVTLIISIASLYFFKEQIKAVFQLMSSLLMFTMALVLIMEWIKRGKLEVRMFVTFLLFPCIQLLGLVLILLSKWKGIYWLIVFTRVSASVFVNALLLFILLIYVISFIFKIKKQLIFTTRLKSESWAIALGWFIPRKYRKFIIGDILEDCVEMHKAGCTEKRIKFHVIYQWLIAVATLIPMGIKTSIVEIIKQVISPQK